MRRSTIDDEEEDETGGLKALLVVLVIFLGACYFSWQELQYMFRGQKAEAEITRVYEQRERLEGGRYERVRVADYEFTDRQGFHRKRELEVLAGWTPPASGKLMIEYLPGQFGAARPAGKHDYLAPAILVACLVAGIFILVKWAREARR
jgi:hypothetical protein